MTIDIPSPTPATPCGFTSVNLDERDRGIIEALTNFYGAEEAWRLYDAAEQGMLTEADRTRFCNIAAMVLVNPLSQIPMPPRPVVTAKHRHQAEQIAWTAFESAIKTEELLNRMAIDAYLHRKNMRWQLDRLMNDRNDKDLA